MKKDSTLAKLFVYAGNFKYLTMLSLGLSAASALLALVPFVYIWMIIRNVLQAAPNLAQAEHISRYGWLAVVFALSAMLMYICALLCSHIAAFRVQANIRSRTMHHIASLPLGFMDNIGSGRMRKIIDESSAATETYLAHHLPDSATALATPVGLLAILLVFDWRLGLLSLLPMVAAFLVMGFMSGATMKKDMAEYQNALEAMSNEAVEYVRGIPVVKTFGQSVFSFKRFKAAIENYEKWVICYTKNMRRTMMIYTVVANSAFAVLIAATFFFTGENATTDFILNLLFYIVVSPIVSVTLNKLTFSGETRMLVEDALKRIEGILALEPLSKSPQEKLPRDNSVVLSNVSFRYDGAEVNALNDINLSIRPGEHVAFIGPSGGGKTTLASVIARFWDVDSGEILIGNANIKDIPLEHLMNTVSFVFQDSKLLKQSIFENVRLAKPDASRMEVLNALHRAQCDDILAKLPKGIDTVIGSKGVYLSGGEQQRITIARAMLKNASVLILDEATAFADPDNEEKMQQALAELSEGKTTITIAHRLSTIVHADRICVIQGGQIIEQGSHAELIKATGSYAEIWNEYNRAAKWKVGAKG